MTPVDPRNACNETRFPFRCQHDRILTNYFCARPASLTAQIYSMLMGKHSPNHLELLLLEAEPQPWLPKTRNFIALMPLQDGNFGKILNSKILRCKHIFHNWRYRALHLTPNKMTSCVQTVVSLEEVSLLQTTRLQGNTFP